MFPIRLFVGISFRNATGRCIPFKARDFTAKKKKKKRPKQKHFFPTAIFKEEALLFLGNKDLQFQTLCKSGLIQLMKIISP